MDGQHAPGPKSPSDASGAPTFAGAFGEKALGDILSATGGLVVTELVLEALLELPSSIPIRTQMATATAPTLALWTCLRSCTITSFFAIVGYNLTNDLRLVDRIWNRCFRLSVSVRPIDSETDDTTNVIPCPS